MDKELSVDPMIGQRFGREGRYLIQKKLGKGGHGDVYLAHDGKRDGFVALKLLREGEVDSVMLERFWREGAKYGVAFDHPNIARVRAYGRKDGRIFIALEFIEGRTLAEIVDSDGAFEIKEALRVTKDIASGLFEAHRANVVHRDLKPSNVMIRSSDGVVKILDFGVAKDLLSKGGLTETNEYIGTDGYAAPEQTHSSEIDHRADIFALGVILYELITGKFAFNGRTRWHIVNAVRHHRPIPPSKFAPGITRPVVALIMRMIEKSPGRRHADMGEVIVDIDRIGATVSGDANEARGLRAWLRRIFEEPSSQR